MERTKETLEARVRETPLVDRLKECQQRIGNMCAELRGPKMSIPVEYYDDDFYICTTLADAQATVEALQAQLEQEREKVKGLEDKLDLFLSAEHIMTVSWKGRVADRDKQLADLQTVLSQLQALVRAAENYIEIAPHRLHPGHSKDWVSGYLGALYDVGQFLSCKRTLDATPTERGQE